MQGGAVQGIGWALNEEYYLSDSGTMDNTSLLDYRMPTSLDLPMIDTVIVEVANPGHPYGVRGVGEAPIIPPTPAIANAIENAIGTRLIALPMNPGAVAKAVIDYDPSSPTYQQVTDIYVVSGGENYPVVETDNETYTVDHVVVVNPGENF